MYSYGNGSQDIPDTANLLFKFLEAHKKVWLIRLRLVDKFAILQNPYSYGSWRKPRTGLVAARGRPEWR